MSSNLVTRTLKIAFYTVLGLSNFKIFKAECARPDPLPSNILRGTNDHLLIQSVTLFKPAGYFIFLLKPLRLHVPNNVIRNYIIAVSEYLPMMNNHITRTKQTFETSTSCCVVNLWTSVVQIPSYTQVIHSIHISLQLYRSQSPE